MCHVWRSTYVFIKSETFRWRQRHQWWQVESKYRYPKLVYSDNAWLQVKTSVQKFKNYNEVQLSSAQLAQSIPETVRVQLQHFWCQPYLAVNLEGGGLSPPSPWYPPPMIIRIVSLGLSLVGDTTSAIETRKPSVGRKARDAAAVLSM